MNVSTNLCRLFHRPHWRFVQRRETGPTMLAKQRHIGIYRCGTCGRTHHVVGDKLQPEDADLPLDAQPPTRGPTMKFHRLLGGPVQSLPRRGQDRQSAGHDARQRKRKTS